MLLVMWTVYFRALAVHSIRLLRMPLVVYKFFVFVIVFTFLTIGIGFASLNHKLKMGVTGWFVSCFNRGDMFFQTPIYIYVITTNVLNIILSIF